MFVTLNEEQLTFPEGVVVIGITGKAGSGKDTIAQLLADKLYEQNQDDTQTAIMSFADNLKLGLAQMLHVDDNVFYRPDLKDTVSFFGGKTYRELLQFVGTELMRTQLSPDVWVSSLIRKVSNIMLFEQSRMVVIIPDVRFYNEALPILKSKHGFLLEVTRDGLTSKGIEGHASEKSFTSELDGKEYTTIENNGTLDELAVEVYKFADYVTAQAF